MSAAASGAASPASESSTKRILSMDQFRGYAVVGMFIVNFLGHFKVTHHFLKHNDTHFAWADSIMPAFIFAAGFSFRLSMLKRIPKIGRSQAYSSIIWRSFALVLVSLIMYGTGNGFKEWEQVTAANIWQFFARILKADLWEVLAIIGVCQLILLPVIEATPKVRFLTIVGLSLFHILISWLFNFNFMTAQPNWMDPLWGLKAKTSWDGGFFGLFSWCIPMLAGTLVYDLMQQKTTGKAITGLVTWGCGLMLLAYAMSCLTTLYDIRDTNQEDVAYSQEMLDKFKSTKEDPQNVYKKKLAASPVWPPFANMANRPFSSLLAEPPFVPPPSTDKRLENYWMMNKRYTTQSFMLFATGFSMATYALFILLCDTKGWASKTFEMFGENPLAAYFIHHFVEELVHDLTPKDSPAWWATFGLILFAAITWLCVRHLQRHKIYIRL